MRTAYITHRDCLKHEMGQGHPECPDRLWAIADHLMIKGLMDLMVHFDAREATHEQLMHVHDELYLRELESMHPEEGSIHLDPDTMMNPFTLRAARLAAGAVTQAVELVMTGEVDNAFCCVRPPGHHAERGAAMGFCFFNNIAVGAAHALNEFGLERVAIIDFDVHHGNGTENIFADDNRVLMVSTFQKGLYPFYGETALGANMVNVGLDARTSGDKMREAVEQHWLPALYRFKPQMIFISAGFDAHREDDMGNLGWVETDYTWITRKLSEVAHEVCKGRMVSSLEGGYDTSALARSVGAHVSVLIGGH